MDNKYCKNCGAQLSDDALYCGMCASLQTDDAKQCENEAFVAENGYETVNQAEKSVKKKRGIISSILITIFAIIVGELAGGTIGNLSVQDFKNSRFEREIDEFIAKSAEYEPGIADETGYTSEYFGLKFEAGDEWVMYTEDEIKPLSDSMSQSAIDSATASLEKENVPQEMIDKWISSVYSEAEAGAYYVADDMVVGEFYFGIYSAYGFEDSNADEYAEMMANKLSASGKTVTGKQQLAGYDYNTVETKLSSDGMNITNKMFIRLTDGIVCMVNCKWIDGYEVVYDSLLEHISEY